MALLIPSRAKPGLKRSTKTPTARKFAVVGLPSLPASTNWRAGYAYGIADQYAAGACTGCATKAAMQARASIQPVACPPLSWQFAYDEARIYEGTFPADDGAEIPDALSQAALIGVATEAEFPEGQVNAPVAADLANAANQKISQYQLLEVDGSLLTQQMVMASLAAGYPISFGITLYRNPNDGIPPGTFTMPNPTMTYWGLHNLCAVDYDQNVVSGINSWGPDWGDAGWFHVTWPYFLSNYIFDIYNVTAIAIIGGKNVTTTSIVPNAASVSGGVNPTGTITVVATYSGDAANAGSTATETITLGTPPPPPPPPPGVSPAGTTVPPAASITDTKGGVWTLGVAVGNGNFQVLLNGSWNATQQGAMTAIMWDGTTITVQNSYKHVFSWTGTSWKQVS